MSFEKRLHKAIDKKEKQIDRERQRIEALRVKLDAHKITRAEFNIKKMRIEEKIKSMNSRMRVLQGGLTREKRHQEELAEENPLTLIDSFDFRGMITGADASVDGNRLAVLTYKGVWLFEVEEDSIEYFHRAAPWLPIRAGQCEAICFDGNMPVISNELGRLFKIPVSDLIPLTNQSG